EESQQYPMGLLNVGRVGLYDQLLDAANALNAGYYGWKYRGLASITFADGRTVTMAPDLNPGTAAVQFFLAQYNNYEAWLRDVSDSGFFQLYLSMFGDPFIKAFEPLIPQNLSQPILTFPFTAGETWYFTGGPHGGYNTGSAWASIDFAPPAPPDSLLSEQGYCYISPYWVTALAPGVIARSGKGYVILDVDFDGNESTGWTFVYLHIADDADLVQPGTVVQTGDRLGHPSCTGGFSSATHLHFGRRYNGEWIPVDCFNCSSELPHALFVMSGWTVSGYENAEYQGFMENAEGGFRRAEQGRDDPINELRYDK
ncbi:MAG TPA: M23 family metallopeptidase, partial [Aggregatilineales bacterium]|nr:M23 family metallopeptidase [Aggregatilineales bacterium]